MKIRCAVVALIVVVGCGTDHDPDPGVIAGARLSLVAADPRDDWAPVGVAFDAASDRLYVLDASQGIVVLDAEGTLVERIAIDNQWGVLLTDLAITGETISVLSDYAGYRLDRADGSLEEYFCLEPGWEPDPQDPEPEPCTYHQSGGLTFVGGDGVVVAAPYHLDCTTNEPVRTVIESFDTTTGTVASQIALARPVLYGGLAWDAQEDRYLAGSADGIVAIDPVSGRTSDAGIDTSDVTDIQGLALDAARRRLWAVDAAARELVRFDL